MPRRMLECSLQSATLAIKLLDVRESACVGSSMICREILLHPLYIYVSPA